MKLCLVIPSLENGGAERVMSELSDVFVNNNHEVHLILTAKSTCFYNINPKIIIHNIYHNRNNRLAELLGYIAKPIRIRQLIKKNRPDIVLSFMIKNNLLILFSTLYLGVDVYISDRANPRRVYSKQIDFLRKIAYRYATGIIAQTNMAKEILNKIIDNKNIKVIPNPVKNIKLYPNVERQKIIINVGRLIPEKGHLYLLDAFYKIDNKEWKLVILGDGPLKQEIIRHAENLGIINQLILPGAVRNVDKWLASASIFAFTSISEGFPNALAEAMAAGLPCVSFDCDSGPRDLIKDAENGFLVDLYDTTSMAVKLNQLITNTELRNNISVEAKEISQKLNRETIANNYISFFEHKM